MELVDFLLERNLQAEKVIRITGELSEFDIKIRPISSDQWEDIRRKCLTIKKDTAQVNQVQLATSVVLAGCVNPNFRDPNLLQRAGVTLPIDLVSKIFKPGEVEKISDAILAYSGFGEDLNEIPKK